MEEVNALYTVIKDIFLLLDEGDRHLLEAYGLTVPRFNALMHLGESPGLSVSELSDHMSCDKSNVTRLIQGLEADDLVRRQPHETDGRVLCLHLTGRGEELLGEALERHCRHNERRFDSGLRPAERAALLSSLLKLRDTLQCDLQMSPASAVEG
ncbi:MAG TPA: MarR family transcriptional regulator [Candidatus Binatia bacterium]|jgi:DNA-binding MarR family transcriptional regulator|nr:MarR family transcriptional regulator [Candidatus Binatia bacterium]